MKDYKLPTSKATKADPLEGLDDNAMLELRTRIDEKLKTDLAHIDLAEELGLQYRAGKALLNNIQDSDVPANQKSQVFNAVSRMLGDIIKQQKLVYSAERLKRYEVAFLKVLEQLPENSRRTFFDLYGEFLAEKAEGAQ